MVDPWSAGNFGIEEESGRRIARGTFYMRSQNDDNQYAHPIDGMIALIDLDTLELIDVEDEHVYPVPMDDANYAEKFVERWRDDLKPLEITQPEGPSFDGRRLEGALAEVAASASASTSARAWSCTTSATTTTAAPPVMFRASIAEMTVPYGDPTAFTAPQNAFDVGEYGLGHAAPTRSSSAATASARSTTSTPPDSAQGDPSTARQRDLPARGRRSASSGSTTTSAPTRPRYAGRRRLVISSISTIGNYEYGFFWYFYQDGSIELEVKATGIVQTGALHDGDSNRHGSKLGPNLYAPHHQHFFCVRLDPTVDGIEQPRHRGQHPGRPARSDQPATATRSTRSATTLRTESGRHPRSEPRHGPLLADRELETTNPDRRTPAYRLVPGENCKPYAQPGSSIATRAAYMFHHLWVTPWSEDERFPAGTFPNQSPGDDGLAVWTAADRNIRDTDVVRLVHRSVTTTSSGPRTGPSCRWLGWGSR